MTFSIVARCERTGMFGIAISSSSPAVAARCSFARASVGAVATQNITDPVLGNTTLDQLEEGNTASQALQNVMRDYEFGEYRQLMVVDRDGATALHTGSHALGVCGDAATKNAAAAGNLLDNPNVPQSMIDAFSKNENTATAYLGERLINALLAGLRAGGEASAVHSAGLLVVDEVSWPVVDLRVDWTEDCPITTLADIWRVYAPQIDDYVTRALNPTHAPSYGVAGDP